MCPVYSGEGIYPAYAEDADQENDQVSSTYEGRHLTFLEADITGHKHTWPTKGHAAVIGENIVGVILSINRTDGTIGAAANAVDDRIVIDTEGIWLLEVTATEEEGDIAVVAGDELYIHKTSAIISKDYNKNTHCHFGYALGNIDAGETAVIAVKVHWDPSDERELVGTAAALYVSDEADRVFKEYHYDAGGGGIIEGSRMALTITEPAITACTGYFRLLLIDHATESRIITGRSSVLEARMDIAVGDGDLRTLDILVLDFNNENITYSIASIAAAYIALRERSTAERMNNLFDFMDHEAYIGTTNANLLLTTNTNGATHSIRIMVGDQQWYILCSNAAPA